MRKRFILWLLGGTAYAFTELLWRGRTHSSMFITGGICFLLIGHLGEMKRPAPLWLRMLLGAAIITGAELAAGLFVNRDYRVWDYRTLPGNFRGQVCIVYSLLWIPVSLAAICLYDSLKLFLFRQARNPKN